MDDSRRPHQNLESILYVGAIRDTYVDHIRLTRSVRVQFEASGDELFVGNNVFFSIPIGNVVAYPGG